MLSLGVLGSAALTLALALAA